MLRYQCLSISLSIRSDQQFDQFFQGQLVMTQLYILILNIFNISPQSKLSASLYVHIS